MSDKLAVVKRHGCKPRLALFAFLQVAFIENGDKLAVVKRHDCKPRLALFALLKLLAPGFSPWMLFYKKGLREFLAACGVHEPSASAAPCGAVVAEGGDEPAASADARHPGVKAGSAMNGPKLSLAKIWCYSGRN